MVKKQTKTRRQKIGELIRRLRIEAEMRQGDLAKAIGAYQSDVCNWEAGRRHIPVSKARKLAKVFDHDAIEFID